MIRSLLLILLLAVSPAWAQQAGTTTPFLGLVYGESAYENGNWTIIDGAVCGGGQPQKCFNCSANRPCVITASWTFVAPVNSPFDIQGNDPTLTHLIVQGLPGQTGHLQDWKLHGSDPSPTLWVDAAGTVNGPRAVFTALPSQTANLTDWKLHAADSGPTVFIDTAGNFNMTQMGSAYPPAQLTYNVTDGSMIFSQVELTGKFLNNSGANFRDVSGCFTAASVGAQCTTHLGWSVAFNSATYRPVCTCEQQSGVPVLYLLNKTATGFDIVTTAVTAAQAQCSKINCIGFQN